MCRSVLWLGAVVGMLGAGLASAQDGAGVGQGGDAASRMSAADVVLIQFMPHTGRIRWQGRNYDLVLTVIQSEVYLAVVGPIPANVRLTVTAVDGQPMPANFPLPRFSLEHRNQFLRPALMLEEVATLVVPTSNTYVGSVGIPWVTGTRMSARMTFASGRRSVLTKIKNVVVMIPNPSA